MIVSTEEEEVEGGFFDGEIWRWQNSHPIEATVLAWREWPEPYRPPSK